MTSPIAAITESVRERVRRDGVDFAQARRELAEANIKEAIERALDAAAPLTAAQITRLSGLLRKRQPDTTSDTPRLRKAGRK